MEIKTFFLSLNCPKCNKKQFEGQKSHYLLEKTLKMVNYEQYLLAICENL